MVEYARDPKTALHSRFEWDDSKAGHDWRLYQARQIIRLSVLVLDNVRDPVRAWVSMKDDRVKAGGGYRSIGDVMSDEEFNSEAHGTSRKPGSGRIPMALSGAQGIDSRFRSDGRKYLGLPIKRRLPNNAAEQGVARHGMARPWQSAATQE